jgi:hypothetical protein
MLLPNSYDGNPVVILQRLELINWSLALFNLLPILPLDGGRISVALIWRTRYRFFDRGYFHAVEAAARFISAPVLGLVVGALMLFGGFSGYALFLGVLIGLALLSAYLQARSKTLFDRISLREVMVPIVETDLEISEYLKTLTPPLKTHYVHYDVAGERLLIRVSVSDDNESDSNGNAAFHIEQTTFPIQGTFDSSWRVGEFLAQTRLDSPDARYVLTKENRWIGLTRVGALRQVADISQTGSSDAESDQP